MKLLLIAILSSMTFQSIAQNNLFDTLKINSSTKLIGRIPQYDRSGIYEKYNFIIEDSSKIKDFLKKLIIGQETENSTQGQDFLLTIVNDFREVGLWTVKPKLGLIITVDGHSYKFDLNQIANLNNQYPLAFYYDTQFFSNKAEYEKYLSEQKKNPNYLFDYEPQFKYEGDFSIDIPKSSKFPDQKAISKFLIPYIEKIVRKEDYNIQYEEGTNYTKTQDIFTVYIKGSKKLFEQLSFGKYKNQFWHSTDLVAYFYYKK